MNDSCKDFVRIYVSKLLEVEFFECRKGVAVEMKEVTRKETAYCDHFRRLYYMLETFLSSYEGDERGASLHC